MPDNKEKPVSHKDADKGLIVVLSQAIDSLHRAGQTDAVRTASEKLLQLIKQL